MKRMVTFLCGIAILASLVLAITPAPVTAQVITVEMRPPDGTGGPFPVGWAVINVPRGDVTMMAILPKNTVIPDVSGTDNAHGRLRFEGWLADLAPPHPCPVPIDDVTPVEAPGVDVIELSDPRIAGTIEDSTIEPVPLCGSRLSSETGFRGFPGLINKTFQFTYFPVSQGLLKKLGPPLGDWQFYAGRHHTNMGLRPFDVVGVTVEPPGTGSPRDDYDPRPNPIVILAAAIPHPTVSADENGNGGGPGGDGNHPGDGTGNDQNPHHRRPVQSIRIR